jgi:hypothetical protein
MCVWMWVAFAIRFFVYVCNIIVILFVMFFWRSLLFCRFFSYFFSVRSIGHILWGFFLGGEICNYKLFSFFFFFSLLINKKQQRRKREEERERGRESECIGPCLWGEILYIGQQGIGVNERDYKRKFLNDSFLDKVVIDWTFRLHISTMSIRPRPYASVNRYPV